MFLKYNYILLFFVILMTIFTSKYILDKTNREMFIVIADENKK
jgi:hypothetical protein